PLGLRRRITGGKLRGSADRDSTVVRQPREGFAGRRDAPSRQRAVRNRRPNADRDARRRTNICPAHSRWSNGSEEWRHVPEAFRCELRLPRWEPEQYVAIAFGICGVRPTQRIVTGNKQRERHVLRLP